MRGEAIRRRSAPAGIRGCDAEHWHAQRRMLCPDHALSPAKACPNLDVIGSWQTSAEHRVDFRSSYTCRKPVDETFLVTDLPDRLTQTPARMFTIRISLVSTSCTEL